MIYPKIIFLFYDLGGINDNIDTIFNNIRNNINKIKSQIIDNFDFNNNNYNLGGIICIPFAHHFI